MSTLTELEPSALRATADDCGDTPDQFTFWTTETGGVRPAALAPVPSVADTGTLPLPFGDSDAGREGV